MNCKYLIAPGNVCRADCTGVDEDEPAVLLLPFFGVFLFLSLCFYKVGREGRVERGEVDLGGGE